MLAVTPHTSPFTSARVASLLLSVLATGCGVSHQHASRAGAATQATQRAPVLPVRDTPPSLAVQGDGFCKLDRAGAPSCLQLSAGSTFHSAPVQRPQGPFARIVPVQKGYCAQTPAGEVTCWKGFEQAPNVKPPPFEGRYEEIVALEAALCGRDAQGVLSCIGGAQQTPQRLADGNAAIYGGSLGVCGITARGAWCSERAWLQHQLTTGAPGDRWRRHLPGAYVEARNDGLGMCARQADGLTRCARFKQPGSAFTLEGRYTRMVVGDGLCLQRSDQVWVCPFRDHEPRQGDYPRATVHIGHDRKMRVVGIDPDGDLVGAPGGRVRGPFVEVRSRRGQLCGLRADQTVYCAGSYQAIQIDTRALQRVERVDAVIYKKPFVKTFGIATDRSVIWPQRHPEAGRGTPIEQLGTFASRSSLFERAAQTMKQQPAGVRDPQAIHDFGCGFRGEGELVCWGSIRGSTQRVRPPRGAFKALAVGGHSAAAIRASDGALVTWGANPWGGFPPKEGVYRAVRATYLNHCAETVEGRVRCWGGAFPRGFEVPFAPHDYALFDAGVCAIRASGAPLECFGDGLEWEAAR